MRWQCLWLHFLGCCLASVSSARIKNLGVTQAASNDSGNDSGDGEGSRLNASSSSQLTSGLQLLQGPAPAVVGKLAPEEHAEVSPTLSYSDYWQDPEVPPRPAPAASSLIAVATRVKEALEGGSRRLAGNAAHSAYFLSALCLGLACLTISCCLATEPWKKGHGSSQGPRQQVEALPRCTDEEELEQYLPSEHEGGYDCALSRPLSSGVPLRLEAIVEEPTEQSVLVSPLTGRSCVLYSAAVARQLHGGMHPVPLAFAAASQKVVLRVRGAQGLRVELNGEDIFLFDMLQGRHSTHCKFADAPDHWQDFVLTHRAAALGGEFQPSSALRAEGEALEFQEYSLLVGARVTAVGELHRSSNGSLSLRPCSGEGAAVAAGLGRSNLTAWERRGTQACGAVLAAATLAGSSDACAKERPKQAGMCKVWVSDDPTLLSSGENLLKRCGL
eukprot:TRINITY_DN23033_c0_g1_i2.p1 TRINITY_DN23033_c0_g1~~TRINITY_DN23033_c0_g1_i2.p1  ORF type:complete len:444 (+),score=79.22 TRINITY_DN23033_c0_g1_i2:211-1542(+)